MSFLPIPAIDLLDGVCVRLHQGDYSKATTYAADPAALARRFVAAGAVRLHIVDLDGAKAGGPRNGLAIAAIIKAVRATNGSVELQVGGGLRTLDDLQRMLDLGADYVIVSSLAVNNPELFARAQRRLAGKILLGVDARGGRLAINGWLENTQISAADFARDRDLAGVAGIIYTDINSDGTLGGHNVQAVARLAEAAPCPVYAAGGIGSIADVDALRRDGIAGAVIGKALYAGKISLAELYPNRAASDGRSLVLGRVPPSILSIVPYKGGKTAAQLRSKHSTDEPIKLSSNENPLGTGKLARQALADPANHSVNYYPDGAAVELRRALARHLGVATDQIICGNGSNDILELCATLTLLPGRKSVYSQHAFIVYKLLVLARSATGVEVPAKQFGNDLEAMAAACCQSGVGAVFLANPNNPTGLWHPPDEILACIRKVPSDVLIVLDEAYHEYVEDGPGASLDWLNEFPNLIITRSFSKLYGLAGLRIGYGISNPQLIELLNRVRQPFNANMLAQAAACAALADKEFYELSRATNNAGRMQLAAGLANLGYPTMSSQANFIAFCCSDSEHTYNTLLNAGVIVRQIGEYELHNWLRTTIGTEAQNEQLLSALPACKTS